jgi:ABC-type ATPase with predicted acetyltransferase domain
MFETKCCPCGTRPVSREVAAVREELRAAEAWLNKTSTPEAQKKAEAALKAAAAKAEDVARRAQKRWQG